jgi:class 3 adenylate cyclase
VTFLFTDVEGSTRRWEADAEEMRVALAAHDKVLRSAIESSGGFVFSHTGDHQAYESLAARGKAMTAFAYDQMDQARAQLHS